MKTRIFLCVASVLLVSASALAQHKVYGKVKSRDGESLPGVKVQIKQTYLGSFTDRDGFFKLEGTPPGEHVFSFSLNGYDSKEITVIVSGDTELNLELDLASVLLEEMLVSAVRANEKTPTSYSNLKKEEIERQNYGQDLPYMLQLTPSTVVTSDAGAGVGYTGIRIRGVDPTRTNVTINGVPVNDSESHGVWWVNMPDFASTVDEMQIQRGVGTSANGSAAFGASINLNTNQVKKEAYASLDNSYGSFNTWKHSLSAGTGLLSDRFTLDLRLSNIRSDGYIDRASSDLKGLYLSGAWLGKNTQLRMNVFSGQEKTYQAWWGTPESVLKGDENEIMAYADRNYIGGKDLENLLTSGRTYNYYTYDNEVDNYQQDHYHLHFTHRFSTAFKVNLTGHYTRGRGYYEQYRMDDDFSVYGFEPVILGADTISNTDLIRRRWLDNHFYGAILTLNYAKGPLELTYGAGANQYLGTHYGEVIWAEFASNSDIRHRYYENEASKDELQSYLKAAYRWKKATFFGDVQYRYINYSFVGPVQVNNAIDYINQQVDYSFINPKGGFMLDFTSRHNAYFSVAKSSREPVRSDFTDNTQLTRPKHESLVDYELGYRFKGRKLLANANLFYMDYRNQLILTGQLNDVGSYMRTNADRSYRAGIEFEAAYQVLKQISLAANLSYSMNRIQAFTEYVDNYDNYDTEGNMIQDKIEHRNTNLSFSPDLIAAFIVDYEPFKNLHIQLNLKHVGKQYLDNTSSEDRKIEAYTLLNAAISYSLFPSWMKEVTIGLQLNNLNNLYYANNGYTWGYIYSGERTVENFYYPQAGFHALGRLLLKF